MKDSGKEAAIHKLASVSETFFLRSPPMRSEVMRRFCWDSSETAEGVAAAADGSGAFSGGSSEGGGAHSSYCFLNAADLTLADDAPIALFEYTEQTPLVLNNPGMVVRLLRFLKPASPPPAGSLQQPQQQQHPTASQSGACEGSGEFETITSPAAAPGSSGTASANEEGSRELQQRVAEHEAKLRVRRVLRLLPRPRRHGCDREIDGFLFGGISQGLLGPFGALRLVEGGSAPQLFGVDLPLEPGTLVVFADYRRSLQMRE